MKGAQSCATSFPVRNLKKFDIGDFKRELIRKFRERVGDKQVSAASPAA